MGDRYINEVLGRLLTVDSIVIFGLLFFVFLIGWASSKDRGG